jgi:hypothetical protein
MSNEDIEMPPLRAEIAVDEKYLILAMSPLPAEEEIAWVARCDRKPCA